MYKIFAILFVCVIATAANAQVSKNHHFYIRADVGGFMPTTKFKETLEDRYQGNNKPKNGVVYNVGLGYVVNDMWRCDANFNYRNLHYKGTDVVDTAKQSAKIYGIFINGYFDLNIHKIIKPYLIVGVGYTHNNSSNLDFRMNGILADEPPGKKTNNFAWNIGAGIKFSLNTRFNVDLSYKYVDLGKVGSKNSTTTDAVGRTFKIRSHDIMGGIIIHL